MPYDPVQFSGIELSSPRGSLQCPVRSVTYVSGRSQGGFRLSGSSRDGLDHLLTTSGIEPVPRLQPLEQIIEHFRDLFLNTAVGLLLRAWNSE